MIAYKLAREYLWNYPFFDACLSCVLYLKWVGEDRDYLRWQPVFSGYRG